MSNYYPPENRTVIFGVSSPRVSNIRLQAGLHSKTITPTTDGAYLAVFQGQPHIRRTITYTDNTELVIDPPRQP